MPKLRDGVEFSVGMTVVLFSGREVPTDDTFEVEEITVNDHGRMWTTHTLRRKDGSGGIGLNLMFSSQAARIADQVRRLQALKRAIDEEIELLREGTMPDDLENLMRLIY